MKKIITPFALVFMCVLFSNSCKKDAAVNPFDDPALQAPESSVSETNLDPNSFAYLYKNVFKVTCNNSNCHDGSFEPDFRTMYGAYNTLVYHPVLSNDNNFTFKHRVVPKNPGMSLLIKRLTQVPFNIIGQGRMPAFAGDTTWKFKPQNATYIQNITNWINAGAKDMFGNSPTPGNRNPQVAGMQVFPAGNTTTPYARGGTFLNDPIEVPQGSTVDVWAYITDDSTLAQNMVVTDIKFSTKCFDFANAVNKTLVNTTAITAGDFYNNSVSFTHKLASFNMSAYPVNTCIYVRMYIKDTSHSTPAEIPNDGSSPQQLKFFTIKII